jgi:CDP-paratose 2-epimerase
VSAARDGRPVLVTGGAGFIGSNLVHRLASRGERVRVLDDLSRAGVERNLAWLREQHGGALDVSIGDVRDARAVEGAVRGAGFVVHLAAQVAVTTSLVDPITDFEINARGTLQVLEAIRAQPDPPGLLFTSTNKVYGDLADVTLERGHARYAPADAELAAHGIGEHRPLEFHSPYGCSKGTADQYVLDYAKTFGLAAAVVRMSCIYGPRQFGNEDQGWVAHFLIRARRGERITLYGDGRQVRDILCVDDLLDAFDRVRDGIDRLAGRAFNVGGGPDNQISLLELVERIERRVGAMPSLVFEPWRRADQRWYVSDVRSIAEHTGWRPRVGVDEGLDRFARWVDELVSPTGGAAIARAEATA